MAGGAEMRLYRPAGLRELLRIFETDMTAFPPRLPEQPIFYPVLNAPYASQIASRWNTRSGDLAGYVTQFDLDGKYAGRFEPHIVGSREHAELWVPAEELTEFNQHIQGKITVIEAYFGEDFHGFIPTDAGGLRGKDAIGQFKALEVTRGYSIPDFLITFKLNYQTIFSTSRSGCSMTSLSFTSRTSGAIPCCATWLRFGLSTSPTSRSVMRSTLESGWGVL